MNKDIKEINEDFFAIPQDMADMADMVDMADMAGKSVEDMAEDVAGKSKKEKKSVIGLTNKSSPLWRQGLNLILSLIGLGGVIYGVFNLYHLNQVGQNSQAGQISQASQNSQAAQTKQAAQAKEAGQTNHSDSTATSSTLVNLGQIYIDVSGAVERPGLYQLPSGSRVAAALEQAGGLTAGADQDYALRQLNLAQKLQDEQKLYFPTQQETDYQTEVAEFCAAELGQGLEGQSGLAAAGQNSAAAGASSTLVSINNAAASQLEDLPEIGEKRAEDIIQNRPYQNLTELVSKEVITEKILAKIENQIKL